MGKISQGILGGVSGTVGNVVGGSWKGINYLRIKADHYSDANSAKQQGHRTKFGSCVALAKSVMDTIIHPIWDRKAVKMSGYNLFVKQNALFVSPMLHPLKKKGLTNFANPLIFLWVVLDSNQ